MSENTYEESFSFFMPAQPILKAENGKEDGKRWIQGIASTDARDLQGEVVVQDGIDFGYFLKNGYFNDDHKDGPEHKVGEPVKCRVTKDGLWVKGFLYKSEKQQKAGHYWDLIQAETAEGDSQRSVGFSIQGKVLRRKGNVIEKCWIQDVAITTAPINAKTWAEVVKSLSGSDWNADEDADDDDDTDKALTASGSGSPTVPESLEDKLKVDRESPVSKSLSFAETVSYVETLYGVDTAEASSIARVAFDLFGT